ncbi:MAG: biotin/lipoyl-binding protein, partial [Cyclobacteriaceae bacterium]|nr:biotin/lipoyl-binding protein [Cyclobacteriaceae bacterium]
MQKSTQNSIFSVFSLLAIVIFSCQSHETKIQPTVEDISESVYASGIVKSENQYQVFSTVSGIIKEILVAEGERVTKGTPLLRIFNKTSELNARNAQLTADYAKLSENQQKLDELKMAVEVAKIKKENDSLLLERKRQLWA